MKTKLILFLLFLTAGLYFFWQVYVPASFNSDEIVYSVKSGMGSKAIASELKNQNIIKSGLFLRMYVLMSLQYSKLQAGDYSLSPSMSVAQIVKKLATGQIIKSKFTIVEGQSANNIAKELEKRNIYSSEEFLKEIKKDWSKEFEILKDKPKELSLEGYIFPDTYEIHSSQKSEDFLRSILVNFDKKMTSELKQEIYRQNKSIFQVITMASIIEKEVKSSEDKKIVAGILWKRMENDMPLQIDATVNYITGKNDFRVSVADTTIDSPYNTYKYKGLPLGPISNPGIDSILAAIYPEKSDYWYYISAKNMGETIFSRSFAEHNVAIERYLNN